LVQRNLAAHFFPDVALRVDEDHRGPRPDREVRPDLPVAVHDHRMRHVEAGEGMLDVSGVSLVVEFGGVHADHAERLAREFRLQPMELGQHVDAVDAAVGPEIQQQDPSLELLGQPERTIAVQPGQAFGEFGRADEGFGHEIFPVGGGPMVGRPRRDRSS
jgi:hypothetical protein